jgi:flagellar hook protein FlgE
MMLTATMLAFDVDGRIRNTTGAPPTGNNGGTPTTDEGVLCVTDKSPDTYINGTGFYVASGEISGEAGGAIASFHQGMAFDAAGHLVTDTADPIAFYLAGLPRTASGALAVAVPE